MIAGLHRDCVRREVTKDGAARIEGAGKENHTEVAAGIERRTNFGGVSWKDQLL
jgi:hypothetical protein